MLFSHMPDTVKPSARKILATFTTNIVSMPFVTSTTRMFSRTIPRHNNSNLVAKFIT